MTVAVPPATLRPPVIHVTLQAHPGPGTTSVVTWITGNR